MSACVKRKKCCYHLTKSLLVNHINNMMTNFFFKFIFKRNGNGKQMNRKHSVLDSVGQGFDQVYLRLPDTI